MIFFNFSEMLETISGQDKIQKHLLFNQRQGKYFSRGPKADNQLRAMDSPRARSTTSSKPFAVKGFDKRKIPCRLA
jgi:hypothetical protein